MAIGSLKVRRAEKAERVQEILKGLYPETPIPLDHRDPYTLLVAVLLSAQCTDVRVNQITPDLFAQAAAPAAMVALGQKKIQVRIKSCGLSATKSSNIFALSKKIVADHNGVVPRTFAELEALPGIGHKTASVVMSQAFGVAAFPVDTHIHRLSGRWGLSRGRNVVATERDLKRIFPREEWNALHLRFIFFGREHCPARYHDFEACPICAWASTKKRRREERLSWRRRPRLTGR